MTVGINANLCNSVVLANPTQSIVTSATVTTTSTTKTKILEHTVASGKNFYLFAYSLTRQTGNATGAVPATLEVQHASGPNTVIDSGAWPDGSNNVVPNWSEITDTGFEIALSAEKVQIYVTPGRATATNWFAKLVGIER